jgi:hypothetical protein
MAGDTFEGKASARIRILLHLTFTTHVNNDEGRERVLLDAKVIHHAVLGGGNIHNKCLSFDSLGDLSEGGNGRGVAVR